ncbi:DUF6249 domain-containing protein [uncultured Sunxiuqinia sp.]|uniref:DUF6249 domain-containing protein n=1 Tax=Sunxiuqinia rutila TaxID=1397841 RepID=UPI0026032719|nr:DUF6249 domain-containing protein [uncultured Sunxiuqinia sp.]
MNEAIVIPVSFFAFIFAMVYVFLTTRNKERMAMIEKGTDPTIFKGAGKVSNFLTLKTGLLFIGVALGVLFGNILDNVTSLEEGTAYVSMIFLFGGLGLVAGYWMQAQKTKE